ncbi:hypothetical protein PY365_26385 [Roseiarcaceae bacterium H3SJ34-1]|uniref:hypothetical protein n=1 Tax=Terripilifer ovatus TaxID=3032367 RepID=UPI003AB99168|nr:hypothetical protein [Roseiarcaceae bacterium H3SJ34-1]
MPTLRQAKGCRLDALTSPSLSPYPLPDSLIELHFGLVKQFDDDRERLPIYMARPTTLASHDKVIRVTVGLDSTFEGDGRALHRSLFPRLRAGSQITIKSSRKFGEWAIVSVTPAIVIEDELGLTSADEPKAHCNAGIIISGVPNRRIECERHTNAAFAVSILKRFRNRNPVNSKMIKGEFIFGVETHTGIVRKSGTLEIDKAMTDNCTGCNVPEWLEPLARGRLRIPTKPAMHSNRKPATYSNMKPARIPI